MITRILRRRTRLILLAGALLSIALGAALGVRESVRTRKAQRAAAERTIADYAGFAAYLYSTRAYLFARDRSHAFDPIHPGIPWIRKDLPPVTVLAPIPDTAEACGPRAKFPVYRFKMDLPARSVTYAGTAPSPRIASYIRDSIPRLASLPWVHRAGFGYAFVDGPDGPEAIAFSAALDSSRPPNVLAVYGYRSCYGVRDTSDYALMYQVVRVLPPALTKMMPSDSLLTLTIRDAKGRQLYKAPRNGPKSAVYGSLKMRGLGNTSYMVEIRPEVAKMLVIGGTPDTVPASVLLLLVSLVLAVAGFATLRSELRLVESREQFLASVSHELRTPLQQILTFVQLLRLGKARNPEERQQSLRIIETETHRLIALSDTVMAAARPTRALSPAAIQVENVVRDAVDFFRPLAESRKMCIDLDTEPATAIGDAPALRQILVNVLDNAAKYGPVGQTVTIGLRDDEDRVRLWVDDHGPGVPPVERRRVWKPFYRLHRTMEQSTGGAGLGLSIVRDLAEQMGAEVEISDAPTGGARFRLSLQRANAGEVAKA